MSASLGSPSSCVLVTGLLAAHRIALPLETRQDGRKDVLVLQVWVGWEEGVFEALMDNVIRPAYYSCWW